MLAEERSAQSNPIEDGAWRRRSYGVRKVSFLGHGINIALLLSILLIIIIQPVYTNKRPQLELAGDITGFAPAINRRIKSFAPDLSFTPDDPAEWFTTRVRNNWLNLVPKGLGYVRIADSENYDNLPTPLPEYDGAVFTTSVTHQLHCLYKLEEFFASMMMSNGTGDGILESAGWHSRHCFEYLRQSILCCGDMTLEGRQTTFPDRNSPGSDGWDAKHVCKDYGQIRRHLEKNRADDKVWI
ncbi:hypothetical protein GQ53DRAFT_643036 [Thozetella sp. PMI_491]|nr:hypothetical protein GQ53DRAFT_643036 [Thozetella sp. PMI_491]